VHPGDPETLLLILAAAVVGYPALLAVALWGVRPPPPRLPASSALTILHLRSHLAHLPHDAVPGALGFPRGGESTAGRLSRVPTRSSGGQLSRADLEGRLSPAEPWR